MKRRILCFVLTLALVLSMLVVIPATIVSADTFDASASEPTITTNADMAAFAAAVNGGNTFAGKTVKLAGDVNLTTTVGGVTTVYPFSGNFNGQGHTVTISQSFSGTQKDGGGLFSLIRVPSGTTLTIQNVHIAGTINIQPSGDYKADTHGGLVSMVETAGSGAKLNITNCWSSIRIEQTNSCGAGNIGGFIGYVSHNNSYLNPLTITFESCVWDGTIYFKNQPDASGGFIGFSGQNKSGRTVTINFNNTVAAGTIDLNQAYGSRVATFIGQLDGSQTGATTTVNATNVLSYGSFVSSSGLTSFGGGDGRNYGNFIRTADNNYTVLNLTNFYWYEWTMANKTAKLVNLSSNSVTTTNVVKYTDTASFKNLTSSAFSDASKWYFDSGIPLPKGCVDTFLTRTIGSDAQMAAFAASVNNGFTYAGVTVNLTANVNLTTLVGSSAAPFSGNFNGNGYTVTLAQSGISTANVGGLFSCVAVPNGETLTIQGVKVAGTISVSSTNNHGGLISTVKTGNSGSCALNITNCWSNVTINTPSGADHEGYGGFIGVLDSNGSYLAPLTVTFEGCLWDGVINGGSKALNNAAGYVGDLNYTRSGRTVTVNVKNSVASGKLGYNYSSSYGSMIANVYTSTSGGYSYLNIQNVIINGTFTSSTSLSGKAIASGFTKSNNSYGVVTVTNAYYVQRGVNGIDTLPFGNDSTSVTGSGTAKTVAQMVALTGSAFSDSSKWQISGGTNYPCPKGFYNIFGQPECLTVDAYDITDTFNIGTASELTALASSIASGKDYAGKTINLTADINTTGTGFTGLGSSSAPFSGNFNGQGHTVTLAQSGISSGNVGGLFSFVNVPANSTVTIQGVKVAGTISVSSSNNHGGLISQAKGNSSTLNITNCWSNVTINTPSSTSEGFGGFIGILGSNITVTFDGCVWDGVINGGNGTLNNAAGFVGDLNYNSNGRTAVVNVKNSVAAGRLGYNYGSSYGSMIANLYTGSGVSGTSTLNIQNVIINGTFSSTVSLSGKPIASGYTKSNNSYGSVSITNAYYVQRGVNGIDTLPFGNDSTSVTGSGTAKTVAQMVALTDTNLGNAGKWQILGGYNYPCPKAFYNLFGQPEALVVDAYEVLDSFNIGTPDALLSLANAVAGGRDYAGKTVNLTADIDMSETDFTGIGSSSAPFSGNFNGSGFTVTLAQEGISTANVGGLFAFVTVPADKTVTIQNLTVAGTITISSTNNHGGLISQAKGNGASSNLNITNCRSSVTINTPSSQVEGFGGFIGILGSSITVTFDGCVWDGIINAGAGLNNAAGFVGDLNYNSTGRTVVVTVKNSAAAGKISFNYSSDYCSMIANLYTATNVTGTSTLNIQNVVITGAFTSSVSLSGKKIGSGFTKSNNAYGIVTVSNVYYIERGISGLQPVPFTNDTTSVTGSGTAKTEEQMAALTASAFSDGSKWKFTANEAFILYYPCPISFPAIAVSKISAQTAITAEARNTTNYKGIRFIGTFYNTSACHNPGTQAADFGLLVISAELYTDSLDSYAKLVAAGAKVAKATKYKSENGTYVVHAVIYDIPNACKDVELVAIPYMDGYLGDVSAAYSYNSLFN